MSFLTAEEITNLYLYGTPTTPVNLSDESLIRSINTPPIESGRVGRFFCPPLASPFYSAWARTACAHPTRLNLTVQSNAQGRKWAGRQTEILAILNR
jgi:hypothetical protein